MMKIGQKTYVALPDEILDVSPGSVVIRLKPCFPLFAFGYGWHSTTRAFVNALEREDLSGKSVLDLGCGNGVLSILAMKLGSARVTALDFSWQAAKFTREHADLNAVQVEFLEQDISEYQGDGFDLVLCNMDFGPKKPEKIMETLRFTSDSGEVVLPYESEESWRLERASEKAKLKLSKDQSGGRWDIFRMRRAQP